MHGNNIIRQVIKDMLLHIIINNWKRYMRMVFGSGYGIEETMQVRKKTNQRLLIWQERNILTQEDGMKNREPIISKQLQLYFDWSYCKYIDMILVSDDEMDYHMFMIYTKRGELLHGYHIERIYNEGK